MRDNPEGGESDPAEGDRSRCKKIFFPFYPEEDKVNVITIGHSVGSQTLLLRIKKTT